MIFTRLFYNADGNEGGGSDIVEEVIVETNEATVNQVEKVDFSLDQMKEWGFDSKEQLEQHFAKIKADNISAEEKAKLEQLDNLEFRKYSISNDFLKDEDFDKHKNIVSKSNYDLVFEKHLAEFKEDNQDIDESDLFDAAKEDFEYTYKLNSEKESVKNRGLAKIEKEANELKAEVERPFSSAKEKYELAKSVAKNYPEFEKFVSETVKKNTPEKAIIYNIKDGENEIPVEIELTQEDRNEMSKAFSKHTNYHKFTKGSQEEFAAELDNKMQSWILANKKEQILSKAVEAGIGIGKAKGSNIGATAPFPIVSKNTNMSDEAKKTLEEEIRESHNRAANRF